MSTEMTAFDPAQLPSTQLGSDDAFQDLSQGAEFLKYLKLYSKGIDIDSGNIAPGHWGIPEGDNGIVDLGASIDVLPLARRPKALDTSDRDAIVVAYDETSDSFKQIAEAAQTPGSGCQYGVSFLVLERSTGRFLELFFGNKSSRPEARKLFPYLPVSQEDIDRRAANNMDVSGLAPHGPLAAAISIRLAKNKKGSWHVPSVSKCSAPISMPRTAVVVREINKFLAVKNEGAEKVSEPETRKARAR